MLGDQRDSVTEDDLAIISAKQKLATMRDRPGYVEAMRLERSAGAGERAVVLTIAAGCGGIIYASKLYVTAAPLMWFFFVFFGALAVLCVFAAIGFSRGPSEQKWGVAVVDKRAVDGAEDRIVFLRETGERLDLGVNTEIFGLLRPGDIGVLHTSGTGPNLRVERFQRL